MRWQLCKDPSCDKPRLKVCVAKAQEYAPLTVPAVDSRGGCSMTRWRTHPARRAGKLRALVAAAASLGLVLLGTLAIPTTAFAATYDCSVRYVKFYQTFAEGTQVRTYCISGDTDMSSEPGNVMGPLGDGNPVVYQDDFDTVNGTSGISSFTWRDVSGDYYLCMYDGTNYTGEFLAFATTGTAHYSLENDTMNNRMSSFKIVLGSAFNCPNQ